MNYISDTYYNYIIFSARIASKKIKSNDMEWHGMTETVRYDLSLTQLHTNKEFKV